MSTSLLATRVGKAARQEANASRVQASALREAEVSELKHELEGAMEKASMLEKEVSLRKRELVEAREAQAGKEDEVEGAMRELSEVNARVVVSEEELVGARKEEVALRAEVESLEKELGRVTAEHSQSKQAWGQDLDRVIAEREKALEELAAANKTAEKSAMELRSSRADLASMEQRRRYKLRSTIS